MRPKVRRLAWIIGGGAVIVIGLVAGFCALRYGIVPVMTVLAPMVSIMSPLITIFIASEIRRSEKLAEDGEEKSA